MNDTGDQGLETAEFPRLRRVNFAPNTDATALDVRIWLDGGPLPGVSLGAWPGSAAYDLAIAFGNQAAEDGEEELIVSLPKAGETIEPYPVAATRSLMQRFSRSLATEAARLMAGQPTAGQTVDEQGRWAHVDPAKGDANG